MKRDAELVGEEEALAVRARTACRSSTRDAPALLQLVHRLDVARLVRIDAAVEQQPVRALQPIDDPAHRVGRLDRQRLGVARRGHEGQHHHVGVAVEEHVLDEFLGPRQSRWLRAPGFCASAQLRLGRPLERVRARSSTQAPVGSTKWPCTSKMNSAFSRRACASCGSSAASARRSKKPPVLPAAALAALNASSVLAAPHADTRKSRREAERASHSASPLRARTDSRRVGGRQRHRLELAVRGGVELDGQAQAVGIDAIFHDSPPG